MKKVRTKKQIVEEMIALNVEEILRLEVVRDFNLAQDSAEAKVQVDAANDKITKTEAQLTWLRNHLESLG